MNSLIHQNLTHLRSLLGLKDLHAQAHINYEQAFGDPADEIASYQPALPSQPAGTQEPDPEDFERDYHWFLA